MELCCSRGGLGRFYDFRNSSVAESDFEVEGLSESCSWRDTTSRILNNYFAPKY